ncbi:MAG: AAA domain-containing protein, partial [Chitinophagales bacterium]
QELSDICNRILDQLNVAENYPVTSLVRCPNSQLIKKVGIGKPIIRWSGVFGIFKTQKQSIIKDINSLIHTELLEQNSSLRLPDMPASLEVIIPYQKTTVSGVPTDPSQQAIVNNITQKPLQIIQGPPGTGKSQSLTAIISNALENNAKCLVVCEKRTALEVVQNKLNDLGLQHLNVIIEDISKDRAKVVNSVRDRIDQNFKTKRFGKIKYAQLIDQSDALKQNLTEQHQFLDELRLGEWKWQDLVGLYLQNESVQSKEILHQQLFEGNFDFHIQEYHDLIWAVQEGAKRYDLMREGLIHPLKESPKNTATQETDDDWLMHLGFASNEQKSEEHPLDLLHTRLFEKTQSAKVFKHLQTNIDQQIAASKASQTALKDLQEEYRRTLAANYQGFFESCQENSQNILLQIEQYTQEYGDDFDQRIGMKFTWIKVMKWASRAYKDIFVTQNQLIETLQQFHREVAKNVFFNYTFSPILPHHTFQQLANSLQQFLHTLNHWHKQAPQKIANYVTQLGTGQTDPSIDFDNQINFATQIYFKNIEQINKSDLLNYHLVKNQQSVIGQLVSLDLLLPQLTSIQQGLTHFFTYYNWKHFYIGQTTKTKQILAALKYKIPKPNRNRQGFVNKPTEEQASLWEIAFKSWYYHALLTRNENSNVPPDATPILQLSHILQQVQKLQATKISNNWAKIQATAVTSFNQKNKDNNVKRLYNKRGSKGQRRNSLRKIIQADFGLFTDFFPVLLVSPVVCSSIIPFQVGLFDVVIFDEASQLRLEDTYTALLRGKHKIVSGDIHQMPPSNYFANHSLLLNQSNEEEEVKITNSPTLDISRVTDPSKVLDKQADLISKNSLLEYAEDLGYHRSFLDFHYRSKHPDLIAFSNAAFYGHRLIAMPEEKSYKAIRFVAVNGLYDKRVNEAEAAVIIELLLSKIKPKANGTLPSVGVATFNLTQRNLILESIELAKLDKQENATKLTQLEKAGLFVKNLENIQGDERDIILISTTFGVRSDGRFIQNFGPINRQKGYKLLNVIITRAKQQVYVCSSIPANFYLRYATDIAKHGSLHGRSCFYAYLAYAHAIEQDNHQMKASILDLLAAHNDSSNTTISQNTLDTNAPLIDYLAQQLRANLAEPERVQTNYRSGGFVLPLVVLPPPHQTKLDKKTIISPLAIECDNSPNHHS